jgi:demethylmenaquinone methyltransferase/2-methoxy-6-polyprenyl-1,4-benzoquinol methylase
MTTGSSDRRSDVRVTAELLASQRAYYEERADDYGDSSKPDRKIPGLLEPELYSSLIDEFAPTGDVLELACGTGDFTVEIVRHARSLTAVDSSPRMLAINRERVADPKVAYVEANIFGWEPDRAYDAVFFGAWISHVPPAAFDRFWDLVRTCLAPDGRVAFVDEDERAAGHDDRFEVDGVPAARRTLSDGRQFDIVKLFWSPDQLESRLRSSGWDISVRPVGGTSMYGVGRWP